jgi:hypothetical protein
VLEFHLRYSNIAIASYAGRVEIKYKVEKKVPRYRVAARGDIRWQPIVLTSDLGFLVLYNIVLAC